MHEVGRSQRVRWSAKQSVARAARIPAGPIREMVPDRSHRGMFSPKHAATSMTALASSKQYTSTIWSGRLDVLRPCSRKCPTLVEHGKEEDLRPSL